MINDVEELDRNNCVFTPSYSRAVLKDGTSIRVESSRMSLVAEKDKLYDLAIKYCQALPYIKLSGIGINFDIEINDYEFDHLISNKNITVFKDSLIKTIELSFSVNTLTNCNVKLIKGDNSSGSIVLNYHADFDDLPFAEMSFDFIVAADSFENLSIEFIKEVFRQ